MSPLLYLFSPVCAVLSLSVVSDSLWPHRLQPARLLSSWELFIQEYCSRLPCPPPGDLPNPRIKFRSPTLQVDSLPSKPPGKPKNTGVGHLSFLQVSWPRNRTRVSCIEDRFLTSWTTREALSLPWIQSVLKSIAHQWRLWLGYESLNIGKLKCQSESGHYDGTKWHQDFPLKYT